MSRAHIVLTKRQGSTDSVHDMKQLRDRHNRFGLLVACAVTAIVTVSCGGGGGDGFVNPPPASVVVSISPTSGTVNVGASTSFAVSITGGSPVPTLSSCSSSNNAIATAAANGSSCSATGVAPGAATITATATNGQTATAQLTVAAASAPALTAFTLTPPTASLSVGQALTLTATPTSPAGATVNIAYQSGNIAVATVAASGVVTAVAVGSAVITATAQGTGANLAPVTITKTSTVTVTANPCTAVLLALPVIRSGSISASSCVLTTDIQRRGDILRVNLLAPTALELRFTPTGFPGYMTALPASESEFVLFTANPSQEVRRTWLMAAGLTEIRLGTVAAGQTGTYTFSAASVDPNVTGCSTVVISGNLYSTQSLSSGDCVYDGSLTDEFFVYSARSCVITMNRAVTASMNNPYLEVYAGSLMFANDNDSGGSFNARISLSSCRSQTNDVLTVRATSFGVNDFGNYVFTVTFGT